MFRRTFVKGLLAVTPIVITLGIIAWLYTVIEDSVGGVYIRLFGEKAYFPGVGVLIVLIFIFLIGMVLNNWIIKKIARVGEKILHRMPLVKTLYRSIVDLMSFFKGNTQMSESRVVMVLFGETKIMGLVSRDDFADLPKGVGEPGEVAVYIPMSYQIGGVTVIVPRSKVVPIDMGIEEGLRFAATAGMPGQAQRGDEFNESKS